LTKKSSRIDDVAGNRPNLDDFEAAKRASVGQLLMKCGRLFNDLGVASMREQLGYAHLRAAHTNLFPHIDLEGTRLTELAKRVGISKQAVGQLVDELEDMGALERVPDPEDGRAKLIRFASDREGPLLVRGLAVLGELEAEMRGHIGARRMKELHRALLAVEEWLLETVA
jgi:DNA-binding MarR family transcriptional regulator